MKIFFVFLHLIGGSLLINAQTTFNFTSNATYSSGDVMTFLVNETGQADNGGPYTINIQDGVSLSISNTDFDLTGLGDFTINILGEDGLGAGGGSIDFSGGNGELTIDNGDKLTIDPLNPDGLSGSGGGGILRIETDGTNYTNAELNQIIEAGGVNGSGLLLPVVYSYFKAAVQENSIMLDWETKTEINNNYFEIEESTDGYTFRTLGLVLGQGTSFSATKYQYEIDNSIPGIHYFRLKQTDFDGKFSYSQIVSVDIRNEDFFRVGIASGQVFLQFSEIPETNLSLFVSDYSGKVLFTEENQIPDGTLEADLSQYPNGIYYLTVETNHIRYTKPVILVH